MSRVWKEDKAPRLPEVLIMLVIVIGRGHGGTRLASSTLSQSGVYMGKTNESGDMIPPEGMYSAVRQVGHLPQKTIDNKWDFSQLIDSEPSKKFELSVETYIRPLFHAMTNDVTISSKYEHFGWKLPETILAFPWIVKLFPDAHYIHWTREFDDAVCAPHLTDDLRRWGVKSSDGTLRESWEYQRAIVAATPKPRNFMTVCFEEFVLRQDDILHVMSDFLDGLNLAKVYVDPSKVGEASRMKHVYNKDLSWL